MFGIVRICCYLFKRYCLKKQQTLSQFFLPFLEFSANFKHFQKKKVAIANEFPKLQNAKDLVRPHSKKRCLRTSFDSPHVKATETLKKSP